MSLAGLLARHVDRPGDRHRLTLLDDRHLRCHDCQHTLVVPASASSSSSTSTSSRTPPNSRAGEACPVHGGWRENCPGCRADALEGTTAAVPRQVAAPPAGWRAQVEAQLREAREARHGITESTTGPAQGAGPVVPDHDLEGTT